MTEIANALMFGSDLTGELNFDNLNHPETIRPKDVGAYLLDSIHLAKKKRDQARNKWKESGGVKEGELYDKYNQERRMLADWRGCRNTFNALRIPGPTFVSEVDRVYARDRIILSLGLSEGGPNVAGVNKRLSEMLRINPDLKMGDTSPFSFPL